MSDYRRYIVRKFVPHSNFRKIFSELMTDVIIPERKNVHKLFQIDFDGVGFQNRFEELCKEIFIDHYPKIASRDIIA